MEGKYEKLLEETKQMTQSIIHDITKEKGWELQIDKDGYKVFTKENPENGLKINRTETFVDQLDLEIFIKQVWDWRVRPQFDDHFAECQLIEEIDENTKIFYGKGKAPMPIVDPRDFVIINRIYKIENGYFLLTKSVEHEKCKNKKQIDNIMNIHYNYYQYQLKNILFLYIKNDTFTHCQEFQIFFLSLNS